MSAATCAGDAFETLRREAVNRERLVLWDDDGCDMTHYPYQRADLAAQPASVRNFELVFLEATENTRADVIAYSGTMGFGYFTALRTGGYVNTNRFAAANEPWRNAVNEFAAMGKDSMDMATDFARRNGKEIFLSLRFNDNHDAGEDYRNPGIMLSPFKAENPETMVGHGYAIKCCGKNAADFAQEKVRTFVKRYMRGYMENYDLDGIEFDFFRHPQLFRTVAMGGHATDEELATMTQLMRDLREMSEEIGRRRGRPFVLCARVPDSFDYCRAIGIDLDAWLRAGLLDFLVVGGYFQLEPWRATAERVHGYGVKCYASLDETRISAGRMLPGRNDKECWLGRIAAAMACGMDGVNLFNIEYFNHEVQRQIMQHDIRDLDGVDKTYFATYVGGGGYLPQNFLVGGMDYWNATGVNPAYPVTLAGGAKHSFEFVFGDDFGSAKWKGKDKKVEVLVLTDLSGTALPTVKVRGRALAGGMQSAGIATFAADEETFAKGTNDVEIVAPGGMTLYDFSVRVSEIRSMPRRNSSDFDFKYEMEVMPTEQDLDHDGAGDFTMTLGSGVSSPYGWHGVGVFDGRPGNCYMESAAAGGEVGGAWQRYGASAATGFTVEARMSIRQTTGKYAFALTASVPDSNSHALLNFTTNMVMWGDVVLTNNVDLNEFHIWRIAKDAAASGYYVWCDGNLIGSNLGSGANWNPLNRIVMGIIGGNYRGAAYVSYLRFTKGGYAPAMAEMDSKDFGHKYDMDAGDARFSPTATAGDWTLSKSDGTATLSGGVLSVAVPQGKLHYWKSTPLDPSVSASSPFTLEMKARIADSWDGEGRVLYLSCGSPRETCVAVVGTNSVHWVGKNGVWSRLCTGDNSDRMHVFRIACTGDGDQATGAGGFTLWRDGEKIAENLRANELDGESRVLFGVGSDAYGGSFELDYIRWTTAGDFAPCELSTGMSMTFK